MNEHDVFIAPEYPASMVRAAIEAAARSLVTFMLRSITWQDSLVRSSTSRRGLRTAQSTEMRLKPPGPALLPSIVSCEPWTSGERPLGCRRLS